MGATAWPWLLLSFGYQRVINWCPLSRLHTQRSAWGSRPLFRTQNVFLFLPRAGSNI